MSGAFEIALWALLVIATATDLLWGKVHNAVTFTFFGAGLVGRLALEGFPGGGEALLGAGLAFALFFPLWRLGAMAGGDVKLLMAVGALTSPRFILTLTFLAILMGAAVGLVVLVEKRARKKEKLTRMPFAPAFLCALLFVKIAQFYQWTLPWSG